MFKLICFKNPDIRNEVYLAFCDKGWIKFKVYCVNGFWVIEDEQGYIQDQNPDLGDLLKSWKNIVTL